MRKFTLLSGILLLLLSCQEDDIFSTDKDPEGVVIRLYAEEITAIETRAATSNMATPDGQVGNVIVYAFDKLTGDLVAKQRQGLEYPDNEVRILLPPALDLELHAVCNADDSWFDGIMNRSDLTAKIVTVDKADRVFTGSLMMHGQLDATAANIADKTYIHKINLRRLATHLFFDIRFQPEDASDKFYPIRVMAYNLPARSWLIGRDGSKKGDLRYEYESNDGDAVYDLSPDVMKSRYLQSYSLSLEEIASDRFKTDFYQFENRRGGLDDDPKWFDRISDANPGKANLQQIFKAEYGDVYFAQGTYIVIEGTYIADNGTRTIDAKYKVYLGSSNDRDFNIKRNSRYTYTFTIRTCDELDTRVTQTDLTETTVTPAFSTPLDAHYNTARCFAYSANDWELYVENAARTPWLEISFASAYKPFAQDGSEPAPQQAGEYATTQLSGSGALAGYFYIHTDEFVPDLVAEAENSQQENAWRSGTVVLRNKLTGSESRLTVTQRPAQLVRLPQMDLSENVTGYREYYVEYSLEKKYLPWGFLKYPPNTVMNDLINERRNGLSNTRKLYDEATRTGGMYNPGSADPGTIVVPGGIALGYTLAKNRDRNGNGRIDNDEIVWYLPALDELAELRRVIDEGHLWIEDDQDDFWSSTPYLAGYTDANPGRAYSVRDGEKSFAMRNRPYNVICCRLKSD